MLSKGRIRKLLTVLVVLLVLDVMFIAYAYIGYRSEHPSDGMVSYPTNDRFIEKVIGQDKIHSKVLVNKILNETAVASEISKHLSSANKDAANTVVFLKTHKTGSSTMQNILLRYGILHNLSIALPVFKASFLWPAPFKKEYARQQPEVEKHHILAHHLVWNKHEIDSIMHPNPVYITILREPISLFRSAYSYYQMAATCYKHTLDQWPYVDIKVLKGGACWRTGMPSRNLLAYDFGLSYADFDNEEAIQEMIQQIDASFKVVMIMDRFDESLILLKRRLRWATSDIVYFKQNAQSAHPNSFQDDILYHVIYELNKADALIYEHFNRRLTAELNAEFNQKELENELRILHEFQSNLTNSCIDRTTDNAKLMKDPQLNNPNELARSWMFRPYGQKTVGYKLKQKSLENVMCRLLALPELSLTHYLKGQVFGEAAPAEREEQSHETVNPIKFQMGIPIL